MNVIGTNFVYTNEKSSRNNCHLAPSMSLKGYGEHFFTARVDKTQKDFFDLHPTLILFATLPIVADGSGSPVIILK